jgi:hypothetical protein
MMALLNSVSWACSYQKQKKSAIRVLSAMCWEKILDSFKNGCSWKKLFIKRKI